MSMLMNFLSLLLLGPAPQPQTAPFQPAPIPSCNDQSCKLETAITTGLPSQITPPPSQITAHVAYHPSSFITHHRPNKRGFIPPRRFRGPDKPDSPNSPDNDDDTPWPVPMGFPDGDEDESTTASLACTTPIPGQGLDPFRPTGALPQCLSPGDPWATLFHDGPSTSADMNPTRTTVSVFSYTSQPFVNEAHGFGAEVRGGGQLASMAAFMVALTYWFAI